MGKAPSKTKKLRKKISTKKPLASTVELGGGPLRAASGVAKGAAVGRRLMSKVVKQWGKSLDKEEIEFAKQLIRDSPRKAKPKK